MNDLKVDHELKFNLLSNPKNFVKSMSVKKFSYLGQIILDLRRSDAHITKLPEAHANG